MNNYDLIKQKMEMGEDITEATTSIKESAKATLSRWMTLYTVIMHFLFIGYFVYFHVKISFYFFLLFSFFIIHFSTYIYSPNKRLKYKVIMFSILFIFFFYLYPTVNIFLNFKVLVNPFSLYKSYLVEIVFVALQVLSVLRVKKFNETVEDLDTIHNAYNSAKRALLLMSQHYSNSAVRKFVLDVYNTTIEDDGETPYTYNITNSEYSKTYENGYNFIKKVLRGIYPRSNTIGANLEGFHKGNNGEKKLNLALKQSFCKYFENVVFKSGENNSEKVEIDAIVVGDNKLLLIEGKDYGGEKITFDNSGFLYRSFKDESGNITNKKENVINQINHHNFVLKSAFSPDLNVENYIIMTDPNTIVEENRTEIFNVNVKSVDILPNIISSFAGQPTDEFYNYIVEGLEKNKGDERTYSHANLEEIMNKAYKIFCADKNTLYFFKQFYSNEQENTRMFNKLICNFIELERDLKITTEEANKAIELTQNMPFSPSNTFIEECSNIYDFYTQLFEEFRSEGVAH